jgi:alpha-tubulin suppressor-like RCC1 family protein/sugar lactone lactonase YvrE
MKKKPTILKKNNFLILFFYIMSLQYNFAQCTLAPNITYQGVASTYATGVPITPLLPINSGSIVNVPSPTTSITAIFSAPNVPRGVAIDNNGAVYVANGNNVHKIVGATVTTIGSGFNIPFGVAVDSNGAVYVADYNNNAVKKIVGSTVTTLVSGINNPTGVAVGNDGAVYVAEIMTGTVKKIVGNVVTTIGNFVQPMGVAVDAAGAVYVADKFTNSIKKIVGTTITTLPGSYNKPWGVAVDNAGSVYVGDYVNSVVKKIVGNTVTVLGTGISYPYGVAVDSSGAVYVCEEKLNSPNVKKIVIKTYSISPNLPMGMNFDTNTGIISGTPTLDTASTTYTITTQNLCGSSTTNVTFATCSAPITTSITVTESSGISNDKIVYPGTPVVLSATNGSSYLWNTGNTTATITVFPTVTTSYTVTATSASGCRDVKTETITVIPNTITPAPTGIQEQIYAGTATLTNIVVTGTLIKWYTSSTGNIVLASSTNVTDGTTYYASQTVNGIESSIRLGVTMRKMSESNQVLCKNVTVGNLITTPTFGTANWFTTSLGGGVLANNTVLTSGNYYVERNIPENTSYILGNGFNFPTGIIQQADGKILICDTSNNAIKRMSLDGTNIETLGSGFNAPTGVAVESTGKILVVDKFNHAIKRMNSDGSNIESLGSGFYYPHAVAVQPDGKIVIADCINNLIKRMDPDGSNIVTLGSGFNRPSGIAIQSDGKIIIADSNNNLIKRMNVDGTNIEILGSAFSYPVGIFVQNDGKILVADSYSSSIKRMNSDGTNLVTLGSGFLSPYGVIQQSDGTILVVDTNRSLIKKLLNTSTSNRVVVNVGVTLIPIVQVTQMFCNGRTVADLVATGTGTINWYNSATTNTPLLPNTTLSTGTYYVSQTLNNCESAKKEVSVIVFADNTITLTGNTLTASQIGATYQWYKCPNTLLIGETNQSYTVSVTGDYKVIMSFPNCSNILTSECTYVTTENYFVKIATNPEVARGEFGTQTYSATNAHRLGIKSNGTLWASGFNTFGQLGDSTNTNRFTPIQVGTRTDWLDAAVGWNFSLGITADGKLWSWGSNFYRALGDPTVLNRNKPEQVGNASNWVSVSAGRSSAFGITSDGKLWGWGQGTIGSNESYTYFPVQVGTAANWVYVECGTSSTYAISSDGKLWSWGNGFLGNGSPQGTTITQTPTQVGTANNWATISCGATHNLGLTSDGKLWAWGDNSAGGLGDNSTINKFVPTQVGTSTNWASIGAGYWASSAIDNDGKLWTWGYDGCYFTGTNYVLSPTLNHGNTNDWEATNANASSYWNIKSNGSTYVFGAPTTCGYIMDNSSETFYTCDLTSVNTAPLFTNLASSGSSATMYQNSLNIYNSYNTLIATVSKRVATLYPIKGSTTAKVWVETNQPPSFVKRHYEIMPSTNAASVTGKVTLYFTQNEFNDFNTINSFGLPTNATDIAGIQRIRIKKILGSSNNNTGLPSTYSGAIEIIDPNDSSIIWNASQNRWEISFITKGFGGFFLGVADQIRVNLKLFYQGYYDASTHTMRPVKANQGVGSSTTYVDDITVELRNATTGALEKSTTAQLQTDGTATAAFIASPSSNYYIVIKHRNGLETWSATPQTVGATPLTFDFTTTTNKAYGNNQVMLETGVYGFYSGDVNQDGLIDPSDYSIWEIDSNNFAAGYFLTDFNGDGAVDPSDYPIWEVNSNNFISASYPIF